MSSKTKFPSINTSTVLYHNDSRVVFKGDWNHNEVWTRPDGEVVTFSSTMDVEANVGLDVRTPVVHLPSDSHSSPLARMLRHTKVRSFGPHIPSG